MCRCARTHNTRSLQTEQKNKSKLKQRKETNSAPTRTSAQAAKDDDGLAKEAQRRHESTALSGEDVSSLCVISNVRASPAHPDRSLPCISPAPASPECALLRSLTMFVSCGFAAKSRDQRPQIASPRNAAEDDAAGRGAHALAQQLRVESQLDHRVLVRDVNIGDTNTGV